MPVNMTVHRRPSGYVAGVLRPKVRARFDPRMNNALALAKAFAPVDKQGGGGRLKSSIRLYVRDAGGRFSAQTPGKTAVCSYELAVEVPYAGYIIHGTSPHIIRSRGPWPLHNAKTGQYFGQMVKHPGTKPNDFLTRAMRQAGMA